MKKQWKGFVSGIVVTLLCVGLIGSAFAAYQKQATLDYTGIKITLNGAAVTPKDANGNAVEPFAIEGTTYLPVRGIASALGLNVDWDQAAQTVKLTDPSAVVPSQAPVTSPEGPTMGQRNALGSAKNYINTMAFSRSGLIKQLEYEGYSHDDAVYGADNCGADWNEQAVKKAQSYLDIMSFSRAGLIDQLEYEGFTYEQAVYGVTAVGY